MHWLLSYSVNTTFREDEMHFIQDPESPYHDIWYNQQKKLSSQYRFGFRHLEKDGPNYNYKPPYESNPSNDFLSHRNRDGEYGRSNYRPKYGYDCDRNTPLR